MTPNPTTTRPPDGEPGMSIEALRQHTQGDIAALRNQLTTLEGLLYNALTPSIQSRDAAHRLLDRIHAQLREHAEAQKAKAQANMARMGWGGDSNAQLDEAERRRRAQEQSDRHAWKDIREAAERGPDVTRMPLVDERKQAIQKDIISLREQLLTLEGMIYRNEAPPVEEYPAAYSKLDGIYNALRRNAAAARRRPKVDHEENVRNAGIPAELQTLQEENGKAISAMQAADMPLSAAELAASLARQKEQAMAAYDHHTREQSKEAKAIANLAREQAAYEAKADAAAEQETLARTRDLIREDQDMQQEAAGTYVPSNVDAHALQCFADLDGAIALLQDYYLSDAHPEARLANQAHQALDALVIALRDNARAKVEQMRPDSPPKPRQRLMPSQNDKLRERVHMQLSQRVKDYDSALWEIRNNVEVLQEHEGDPARAREMLHEIKWKADMAGELLDEDRELRRKLGNIRRHRKNLRKTQREQEQSAAAKAEQNNAAADEPPSTIDAKMRNLEDDYQSLKASIEQMHRQDMERAVDDYQRQMIDLERTYDRDAQRIREEHAARPENRQETLQRTLEDTEDRYAHAVADAKHQMAELQTIGDTTERRIKLNNIRKTIDGVSALLGEYLKIRDELNQLRGQEQIGPAVDYAREAAASYMGQYEGDSKTYRTEIRPGGITVEFQLDPASLKGMQEALDGAADALAETASAFRTVGLNEVYMAPANTPPPAPGEEPDPTLWTKLGLVGEPHEIGSMTLGQIRDIAIPVPPAPPLDERKRRRQIQEEMQALEMAAFAPGGPRTKNRDLIERLIDITGQLARHISRRFDKEDDAEGDHK